MLLLELPLLCCALMSIQGILKGIAAMVGYTTISDTAIRYAAIGYTAVCYTTIRYTVI